MAKVKTSGVEDQLSVVAQLLTDTQKNITVLQKVMENVKLDKEEYKRYFLLASKSTIEEMKSVTGQEIAMMELISKGIVTMQEDSTQSIQTALSDALAKIEQATTKRVATAKQVYWLAGIVAIVLGTAVVSLEINRGFDSRIIQESLEKTKEAEYMTQELLQWMRENPKDAKKFKQWYKVNKQ